MARVIFSRPSAPSPEPVTRLGTALVASAAGHWLLLSALLPDLQWQAVAPGPAGAPITVRLVHAPAHAPEIPVIASPQARRSPLPVQPPADGPEGLPDGRPASRTTGAGTDAPTLPGAPDLNYYAARELDDYPRPLVPLRIDRLAGVDGGEVRLEILIDERGIVRDVAYAGAAPRSGAEEALRAMLAATPFLPAFKGGRPVRSRILLSLTPGADDREP